MLNYKIQKLKLIVLFCLLNLIICSFSEILTDSNISEDESEDVKEQENSNLNLIIEEANSLSNETKSNNPDFNLLLNQIKVSDNSSQAGNETKVECVPRNLTENVKSTVKIVNSTNLIKHLTPALNSTSSNCVLVLFYYRWCVFSAQAAVPYNALGRLFPQIYVLAIDSYLLNSLNMRFGLVGVPSIIFFHNGKIVGKFNNSSLTIDALVSFVNKLTGLEPDPSVNISLEDLLGPVPVVPQESQDIVLIISTLFLILMLAYLTIKSAYFNRIVESLRNTWREAEAHHEHLE